MRNYDGPRPENWTTKTYWVHLAKNIATDNRISRRNEFTRHDVLARALRKTEADYRVANREVAASYAFHYLVKTGYFRQVSRGVFAPTSKLRGANPNDIMWDCFAAHRQYANERASQNGNQRGIRRAVAGLEKHADTLRGLVCPRRPSPRKSKTRRLIDKLEGAIDSIKDELEVA